jgi:hypothetical protein
MDACTDCKQVHEVEEATRAVCRGIITTIRTRHNLNRKDAEEYFQRSLSSHTDAVAAIITYVDDDIAEHKGHKKDNT